jgi:hypothetical protein
MEGTPDTRAKLMYQDQGNEGISLASREQMLSVLIYDDPTQRTNASVWIEDGELLYLTSFGDNLLFEDQLGYDVIIVSVSLKVIVMTQVHKI